MTADRNPAAADPAAKAGGKPAVKSARERILEVATDLFYREGIRAIGVDTIVARSGVAKMSLYRSFPSKDDLVAAFLTAADQRYWTWWDQVVGRHPGAPREQLRALFGAVAKRTTSPDYRGCPFVNTATEFPDAAHPGRAVALANKRELRARLRRLAEAIGARDPDQLADQLWLLLDGAYASGQMLGVAGPGMALPAAADALIEAQLGTGGSIDIDRA
ncbi:MAG: TetR/AcrR family transcriptional regulator [Pseudomonadota bacterium]